MIGFRYLSFATSLEGSFFFVFAFQDTGMFWVWIGDGEKINKCVAAHGKNIRTALPCTRVGWLVGWICLDWVFKQFENPNDSKNEGGCFGGGKMNKYVREREED